MLQQMLEKVKPHPFFRSARTDVVQLLLPFRLHPTLEMKYKSHIRFDDYGSYENPGRGYVYTEDFFSFAENLTSGNVTENGISKFHGTCRS